MNFIEIKALLANDEIEKAIKVIFENLESLEESERTDIILLSSRFRSYKKKQVAGYEEDSELNRFRSDLLEYLNIIERRRVIFQDTTERKQLNNISKQDELATISRFRGLRRKVLNSDDYNNDAKLAKLADRLEEIREKAIELDSLSKSFFVSPETRKENNDFIKYLFEAMRIDSVEKSLYKLNSKIGYLKLIKVLIPFGLILLIIVGLIYEGTK